MTNNLNSISATVADSVPLAIASWLACLAIVLVIGLLIVKVAREIRGKPAAGDVQAEAAEKFVTKKHCDKQQDLERMAHQELFSKIGGVERGAAAALQLEVRSLRDERRADAVVLQGKLSDFERQIGGLIKASELQTVQLNRMDQKLDNIIASA
ncbi:MAG: hypothetical protein ABFD89_05240 [Bryobacteraceae bacterium]